LSVLKLKNVARLASVAYQVAIGFARLAVGRLLLGAQTNLRERGEPFWNLAHGPTTPLASTEFKTSVDILGR